MPSLNLKTLCMMPLLPQARDSSRQSDKQDIMSNKNTSSYKPQVLCYDMVFGYAYTGIVKYIATLTPDCDLGFHSSRHKHHNAAITPWLESSHD